MLIFYWKADYFLEWANVMCEIMKEKSKKLYICNKPPITLYKNYLFPLYTFYNDDYNRWIISHFTNMYMMKDENGYIWYDYLEPGNFCDDILETQCIKLSTLSESNIIDNIISNLENNKYMTLFVDEYYLPNTLFTNKIHYPSEILIYGYDSEKKTILSMNFDITNTVNKVVYSYDEIINATDALMHHRKLYADFPVWIELYAMRCISVKENVRINVASRDKLLCLVEEYISSKQLTEKLRSEVVTERGKTAVFGYDSQKEIIKAIKDMINGDIYIDYRHLHLLFEHKRIVLELISYVLAESEIDGEDIISEYKKIYNSISFARILYLKGLAQKNASDIYGIVKDRDILEKIVSLIEKSVEAEKEILELFLENVKNK